MKTKKLKKELHFTQILKDEDNAIQQELSMTLKAGSTEEEIVVAFFEYLEMCGYDVDANQAIKDLGLNNRFCTDWNSLSSM